MVLLQQGEEFVFECITDAAQFYDGHSRILKRRVKWECHDDNQVCHNTP